MNERLQLSTLWDRVAAYLRDDLQLVLPIAGAFFFLPSIILTYFMPATTAGTFSPSMLPPMLLVLLLQTVGQLAIFSLMLDPRRPTVSEALHYAMQRLLPAVGVQFIVFAMVCALLVVAQLVVALFGGATMVRGGAIDNAALMGMAMAGLLVASPVLIYFLARLSIVFPVVMLERLSPVNSMRRAFELTKGNGWRIAAIIVVAIVLYMFVLVALGAALGGVFMLIGRLLGMQWLGNLLTLLVSAGFGTIANLIITVGLGFLYRDLAR